MTTCIAAFFLDLIIGDPQTRFHPVALLGRLIGWLDRFFYQKTASPRVQLVAGAIVVAIVL